MSHLQLIPGLPPGSLVAVIAPAGPVEPGRLPLVEPLYAAHGLRCRIYPGCAMTSGYLAGPDAQRLADLHAALADDEVAAIHCIRGGYGALRLLDGIDVALVRRAQKLLVGYSDITALHALWCLQGLPSLHAPMAASDLLKAGDNPDLLADSAALFAALASGYAAGDVLAPARMPDHGLHVPGVAEGLLVGGNLSLVASLLGTPWAWPVAGNLLFLEDINEDAYRVDRLLTQLHLAGVFQAAAGFVLGSFTEMSAPFSELHARLLPLGKPVLGGWPAGHGTPNRPLPLGVWARLDSGAGTLTLRAGHPD